MLCASSDFFSIVRLDSNVSERTAAVTVLIVYEEELHPGLNIILAKIYWCVWDHDN